MSQSRIRNFCIVAHIDHGKSTLADRLIEATGAVEKRQMREQLLDTMDLERERGITIKLNAVRMSYPARDGVTYELNLIDTPGHVDFTYEVSRSLAACEGAILVVDASQGVQAQTLSNLFLAMDAGLEIIPVLNKIDLPGAEPEKRAQEIMDLIGAKREEILAVSAKEGTGVPALLEAVVARVPPPRGQEEAPLRALIFDSYYDRYRGAIPSIRVVDGAVREGMEIAFGSHPDDVYHVDEVGYLQLGQHPAPALEAGEVGYIVASLRGVRDARVGDTVLDAHDRAGQLLPGYRDVKSMVFAGIYPTDSDQYEGLRDALEKLRAQRRQPALRARVVDRPRLRLPLRLPRPAAHGDRPGAARARVQPEPDHHGPDGGVPRLPDRRRHAAAREPEQSAGPGRDRPHRRAVREGADHGAGRLHRRHHEAGAGAAGRVQRHALHRHHPGRVRLRVPAGRDRARLLRQAQVDVPRVRLARLRDGRVPASRIWSSSTC